MDNYTKIMQMSKDELAKFLFDISRPFIGDAPMEARKELYTTYREYLDMEVEISVEFIPHSIPTKLRQKY